MIIFYTVGSILLLWLGKVPTARASSPDSLEIKIGQMIMVGFRANVVSDTLPIINNIKAGRIGGVILFDYDLPSKTYHRNIQSRAQLSRLIRDLQKASKTPLFIAIDQEGGRVNRLKPTYGFPVFISADSIGKLPLSVAKMHAKKTAETLASVGINMNFSPVVDINVNPANPIIGRLGRSFSSNPDVVITRARVFADAFRRFGVAFSLKHFPGHGSSIEDSHHGFVDITSTWRDVELKPYRSLIKENRSDMVMVAHLFHKMLDSTYPASLSAKVIGELLRKKLGYNGVIVTDDMQMKAITKYYNLQESIELAINAGADLLLFSNNSDTYYPSLATKVYYTILSLVKEGRIPQQRIDMAYKRLMILKKRITQ